MLERVVETIPENSLFADVLKTDFERRKAAAPSLSLRSYADSLEIQNSTVSQILRGKRIVGSETVQLISKRIGLTREEIANLIRNQPLNTFEDRIETVSDPNFTSIRDWRFDAVLELLNGQREEGFDFDGLATRLGISTERLIAMIDALEKQKLLSIEDGVWKDMYEHATSITNAVATDEASRAYQRSLLETSMTALDTIPSENRNHTSTLIQIHPDDFPRLIGEIKKLRHSVAAEFQKGSPDERELFALQVALFPLAPNTSVEREKPEKTQGKQK